MSTVCVYHQDRSQAYPLLLTPPGGSSHSISLRKLYSGDGKLNKNRPATVTLHHCLFDRFFWNFTLPLAVQEWIYGSTMWERWFLTCHTPNLSFSWIHSGVHLQMAQSTLLLPQFVPRYMGVHLSDIVAMLSQSLNSPDYTPRIKKAQLTRNLHIKNTVLGSNYNYTTCHSYHPLLLSD